MDLSAEKELFLKRFEKITDIELIKVLNAFLDYALTNETLKQETNAGNYELSEEHKQILNERLAYYQHNKDKLISWEDVKKRIRSNE